MQNQDTQITFTRDKEEYEQMYVHYVREGFYHSMAPTRMVHLLEEMIGFYSFTGMDAKLNRSRKLYDIILFKLQQKSIKIESNAIDDDTGTDGGYTWVGKENGEVLPIMQSAVNN